MVIVAVLVRRESSLSKSYVSIQVWQSCSVDNQIEIIYWCSFVRGGGVVDRLLDYSNLILIIIVPINFERGTSVVDWLQNFADLIIFVIIIPPG